MLAGAELVPDGSAPRQRARAELVPDRHRRGETTYAELVKHATPSALDSLEPLLAELRRVPGLREKKRGTFYRGASAFLHFHEDPAGLFADVRLSGDDFTRLEVTSPAQQKQLLARVDAHLAGAESRTKA